MYKIKYHDIGFSSESKNSYNSKKDAFLELKACGFKFNNNTNVFYRCIGKHYQEATITENKGE